MGQRVCSWTDGPDPPPVRRGARLRAPAPGNLDAGRTVSVRAAQARGTGHPGYGRFISQGHHPSSGHASVLEPFNLCSKADFMHTSVFSHVPVPKGEIERLRNKINICALKTPLQILWRLSPQERRSSAGVGNPLFFKNKVNWSLHASLPKQTDCRVESV